MRVNYHFHRQANSVPPPLKEGPSSLPASCRCWCLWLPPRDTPGCKKALEGNVVVIPNLPVGICHGLQRSRQVWPYL